MPGNRGYGGYGREISVDIVFSSCVCAVFVAGFGINVKDGAGGLPRVVAFEMNKRDDECASCPYSCSYL